MMSRINKLRVKHGKTINPEPQSEEAKIRRTLNNCSTRTSLSIKIQMIRTSLSSGEREARKMPHTCITEEITAEWLSFGEENSVQTNAMNITEIAAMRAEMADLRAKVAHGAATSQMGQGKSVQFEKAGNEGNHGHVKGDLVKHGTCLVPGCSNQIEAPARVTKKPTM
jgi:hypothetical protein